MTFLNRCIWTPASAGTGSFVVSAAAQNGYTPANCRDPAVVDGATYNYFATNGTDHEEGTGVWSTSTSTLTRATIRNSSNSGSAVNFTSAPVVTMGGPTSNDLTPRADGSSVLRSLGSWFAETKRDRITPPSLLLAPLATTLPTISFTKTNTPSTGITVFPVANTSKFLHNVVEPLTNVGGSGGYGSASYGGTACTFEWWSDAASIDLYFAGVNTVASVYVNGQRIQASDFQTDASGATYVLNLTWAGSNVARNYKIVVVNSAFQGTGTTAADSMWAPKFPRKPLNYILGDSYTFGTGTTSGLITNCANVFCSALGMECLQNGIGGTGYTSATGNDPLSRVNGDLLLRTIAPDYVTFALGYNDAGGNMTTLSTNFNAAVAAIKAGLPYTKILVLGPWTPLGETTNLATVKTTLSGLCTTAGLPFIDISTIITTANSAQYGAGDNTHPNQAGHQFLGGRVAELALPFL